MMTTAYIYKWIHLPSQKWYLGSRTAKNCHPDDGYICSSKLIKPLILSAPNEWKREILAEGTPESIINLEAEMLTTLNAKNNPLSFNMHNGDGKFTTAGVNLSVNWKSNISKSLTGKKKPEKSKENYIKANRKKAKDPDFIAKLKKPKPKEHGQKVSKALSGIPKSEEHKSALSKSQKSTADKLRTGKTYEEIFGEKSAIIKQKISQSQKGKPCNNPIVTCPHCKKSGPSGAMKRWHFDNCKQK
jgi:hypothetical protein